MIIKIIGDYEPDFVLAQDTFGIIWARVDEVCVDCGGKGCDQCNDGMLMTWVQESELRHGLKAD